MDLKTQIAVDILKTNLDRKFSLSELADSLNLSRSHLCYLFKSQTGLSPGQYVTMLRMREARRLLTTSLYSVKQIMAMVGYDDKSHFTRKFKEEYGLTPSQYRKENLDYIKVKNSPTL